MSPSCGFSLKRSPLISSGALSPVARMNAAVKVPGRMTCAGGGCGGRGQERSAAVRFAAGQARAGAALCMSSACWSTVRVESQRRAMGWHATGWHAHALRGSGAAACAELRMDARRRPKQPLPTAHSTARTATHLQLAASSGLVGQQPLAQARCDAGVLCGWATARRWQTGSAGVGRLCGCGAALPTCTGAKAASSLAGQRGGAGGQQGQRPPARAARRCDRRRSRLVALASSTAAWWRPKAVCGRTGRPASRVARQGAATDAMRPHAGSQPRLRSSPPAPAESDTCGPPGSTGSPVLTHWPPCSSAMHAVSSKWDVAKSASFLDSRERWLAALISISVAEAADACPKHTAVVYQVPRACRRRVAACTDGCMRSAATANSWIATDRSISSTCWHTPRPPRLARCALAASEAPSAEAPTCRQHCACAASTAAAP